MIPASQLDDHLVELPEGWGVQPTVEEALEPLLPMGDITPLEIATALTLAGFSFEWSPQALEMLVVWEDDPEADGYIDEVEAECWLVCPVCGDDEGFGYQELVDAWRRGASINKGGLLTLDSNAEYGDGGDVPGIVCHDHATQLPLSLPEGWELDWS